MTKETEVALAAIDALCKKRKAKALRKLVLAAVESERTPIGIYGGITLTPDAGTTCPGWYNGHAVGTIGTSGSAGMPHYTETYTTWPA